MERGSHGRAPGLDLARALAIGAVLLCHLLVLMPEPSPRVGAVMSYAGESGVNLFFALSGFLIGRIALRQLGGPGDTVRFWARRWFRTLPAALAVAVLLAIPLQPSLPNLLSTMSFTRGLFRDATQSWFLPHYWSLMVEEWFYLLLPLMLLAIGPGRRRLGWLAGAWAGLAVFHVVAAAGMGLSYWQQATLTWMRLDAIMAGVVVAGAEPLLRGRAGRIGCAVGWGGNAALYLVMLLVEPAPVYDPLLLTVAPRGLGDLAHAAQASLVPVLFALTLPAMAAWRPARPQALPWVAVRVVALLTYALYLVHWNVYQIVAQVSAGAGLHPAIACGAALGLSLGLAAVLFAVVERPFMALRDRVAPDRPLPAGPRQLVA